MRRLLTYARKYPKQLLLLVGLGALTVIMLVLRFAPRRKLTPSAPIPDPAPLQKALEAARGEILYENARAAVELSRAYTAEAAVREEAKQIVANKNGSERRKQMAALAARIRKQ